MICMDYHKRIKCKYCDSSNVVKYGTFKGIQRYWCKNCKHKFVPNNALPKMKTDAKIIASAMDMYYGGMRLVSIQNNVNPAPAFNTAQISK